MVVPEFAGDKGRGEKPRARFRSILDSAQRRWEVYEARLSYDRSGAGSLIFDSQDVVRRLKQFPSDWYSCEESVLVALCEGRPSATTAD